jgi:hypothetical protein
MRPKILPCPQKGHQMDPQPSALREPVCGQDRHHRRGGRIPTAPLQLLHWVNHHLAVTPRAVPVAGTTSSSMPLNLKVSFKFLNIPQMLTRNTISHISPSVESIALSTTCHEPISSCHPSQRSIVRPDKLRHAATQTHA